MKVNPVSQHIRTQKRFSLRCVWANEGPDSRDETRQVILYVEILDINSVTPYPSTLMIISAYNDSARKKLVKWDNKSEAVGVLHGVSIEMRRCNCARLYLLGKALQPRLNRRMSMGTFGS